LSLLLGIGDAKVGVPLKLEKLEAHLEVLLAPSGFYVAQKPIRKGNKKLKQRGSYTSLR
jgi:hypothetical protein